VFGTGLNYVAMRLLGVDKDHPVLVRARATLHKLGKPHHAKIYQRLTVFGFQVAVVLSLLGASSGFPF